GVESRKHHPGGTHVEDSAGSDPIGGLRADDERNVVRGGGEDLSEEDIFSPSAVFQVDQQPVESAEGADFRSNSGSHAQECPDLGFGGANLLFPADYGHGVPKVAVPTVQA
ncbi:MAG: hypothetical protein K0S98_1652, partial [Propionibacteriaceae bacterium]|nr:hypothetical protein [Propionibacteriaceae bacterium]